MSARLLAILAIGAGLLFTPAAFAESAGKFETFRTAAVEKPPSKVERAKLTKAERAKLDREERAKAKAEAAKVKAEDARKAKVAAAKAKAEADRKAKIAEAKAQAEAARAERAKAREERLAAAKSERERMAAARAERTRAREEARQQQIAAVPAAVVESVKGGNTGELRSEGANAPPPGIFSGLFGGTSKPAMLAETRALDSALEQRTSGRKFKVKPEFEPQSVPFSGYQRGTIVVDTDAKFLYLIESSSTARRYAIAVGREGLAFKGTTTVGDKQEWPRWFPTIDMQKREPKKYGPYKDGMNGGPDNPLGARAIYLYQGKKDTHIRIHGTNQPQTIGSASSNGCFRMVNDHVIDLYGRVKMGTTVVVL